MTPAGPFAILVARPETAASVTEAAVNIHLPDLLAIRNTPNNETRLYALIGAAISLAAAGEVALFEVYQVASEQDEKAAAGAFYRFTRFQNKRDLAEGAVSKLRAAGNELREWDGLVVDLQGILAHGARNLVGHNPVQSTTEIWLGADGSLAEIATKVFVEQNRLQVELSQRSSAAANESALLTYCQQATTLCLRLVRLAERIRGILEQQRQSDGSASAEI